MPPPSTPAAPSQLLAAYGFNEGSGTTSQDTSGNANTLTLTSTTWTTSGRSSNGLSFNGTSSRARTASTVELGSQFTIEAWVLNPANTAFETIASVGSNRDLYLANGTLGFWNGTSDVTFGAALPVNTWTHVALTSDGAALRAYVNGVQQGATQNVALPAFSGQLQLGAWITGSSNADFLGGTIDEVRVYNRALAAAEIQADMVTPVSPPPPDTVAPVVSGGLPTGTLAAGTTSASLQVTTNESATCRYATTAGTAYAQMATTFATTGATAHSHPVTGLANGQSYTFYVRCQDPAGNATTADTVVSFAVANPPAPDTVPPTVALTAPAAGATVSGSVNVTANASDNVAVVGVQFLLDGVNLGAEDTTAPYSVAWNTVAATNGTPHADGPGSRRGGQHHHVGGAHRHRHQRRPPPARSPPTPSTKAPAPPSPTPARPPTTAPCRGRCGHPAATAGRCASTAPTTSSPCPTPHRSTSPRP